MYTLTKLVFLYRKRTIETLPIHTFCWPECETANAWSAHALVAKAPSEFGFRFLLLKHGFRNHSTLNLPCRCLGHIIGQEDLRPLSSRVSQRERSIYYTCFGTLNLATLVVIHVRSSSGVVFSPSLSTTARPMSWPYISSAMAKQTASATD